MCFSPHVSKNIYINVRFFFFIILQATEEMNFAKSVYEGINNELKEELPVIYDRSEEFFYDRVICVDL